MPRGKSGRGAPGSGSIRKKCVTRNGKEYVYWEARYTDGYNPKTGRQRQKSITGKTQKEVAQKLREVTVGIDQGTYREPCKLLLGEWMDIWLQDYTGNLKPRTVVLYRSQIDNHIRPELGAVSLEHLTPHMIQHFYNECGKKLAPKSVKNIHGILHKALQQAMDIGYLPSNLTNVCTLPRVKRKPIKPLDDNGIRAFMEAIKGHRFEYLYLVTLFTGIRQGEVLGLTWDCVDFERGTILIDKQLQRCLGKNGHLMYALVSTKTDKPRKLTVAAFVMDILRRQRARQSEWRLMVDEAWADTNLVFTDELGASLKPYTVYENFKKLVKEIGLPETRFHDLRHSYAVAAIKSGDDIKTVQENLGHATAVFTLDVYGHVTDQMKQESAQRMENYIKTVSG